MTDYFPAQPDIVKYDFHSPPFMYFLVCFSHSDVFQEVLAIAWWWITSFCAFLWIWSWIWKETVNKNKNIVKIWSLYIVKMSDQIYVGIYVSSSSMCHVSSRCGRSWLSIISQEFMKESKFIQRMNAWE